MSSTPYQCITQPLLRYLSTMSPVHLQCLARACWAYPQFTTSVFSSTMSARLSSRQYVTDSSLKPPLDLGILSNLAKTLSEHCQSTVRALSEHSQGVIHTKSCIAKSSSACPLKSFSARRQIVSEALPFHSPVLSPSRPRSSTSSRS